jgi:hypothetical protein
MKYFKKILGLCFLLGSACTSDKQTQTIELPAQAAECENLNPLHCLMPWPSSRYLVDDASTQTKRRIELPQAAMPANRWEEQVDASSYNRFDGFSAMTSMVTVFDGEVDTTELPPENNIPKSLTEESPTVLIDAETNERVGHFSEINEWDGTDPQRSAFYIRPATRLKEGHRYIVAIRNLRDTDGKPFAPSDYFRALRDDIKTNSDEAEARRPHFEDIFSILKAANVARENLIQAWDFETASQQSAQSDLVHMRDDAMAKIGADGLGCTITEVEQDPMHETIYRRVRGTFTVPLYLETDQPGARLVRDSQGRPVQNGTAEARFQVVIPHSVKARLEAGNGGGRLLTYGHGLMGSYNEVGSSFQRGFFNRFEIVGIATDWWGMYKEDTNNVASALGQLGMFVTVTERLAQGVINNLVMTRTIAGVCAQKPELQIDGQLVFAPEEKYYLGISQGSVMGTTVAALSQDIKNFILNVGGISYPIMIIRSVDFPDYNKVIQAWYPTKLDTDLLMVMIAQHWDTAEPAGFARHLIKDPIANTPIKNILYTIGRYDAQVPNISSDIAARTIGLKVMSPSVYDVWGLETTTGPSDSAYVIYDVGAEPVPLGSRAAAEDNVAHEAVRRAEKAQLQMDAFMRPNGKVENFCDGICDPD